MKKAIKYFQINSNNTLKLPSEMKANLKMIL